MTLALHSNGLATVSVSLDGGLQGDAASFWIGVERAAQFHDSLRVAGARELSGAQTDCLAVTSHTRYDIITYQERWLETAFTSSNTFSIGPCPVSDNVRRIRSLLDEFVLEHFSELLP